MSLTRLPEPRRTRTSGSCVLLVAVLAAAVLGLTACGGGAGPQTVEIVVPAGTDDRLRAGEDVVVMPQRLELRVGDTLAIRNDDDVTHSVGPYHVNAGSRTSFQFGRPGTFEGYCPLSKGDHYEIVVTS